MYKSIWRAAAMFGFLLLPVAKSDAATAKATAACRIAAPKEIAGGTSFWIGPCRSGVADGLGTLRVRNSGGRMTFFFGRVAAGRPFSGIMADEHNLFVVAYRFDKVLDYVDPGGDRRKDMEAHNNAAAGAMAASRYYRTRGNLASARYYSSYGHSYATAFD